ncbi:hypothetical protein QYF36_002302 [Acer negundo]|nr:hypothetical protein QYF36_002302 [Acer negundo]
MSGSACPMLLILYWLSKLAHLCAFSHTEKKGGDFPAIADLPDRIQELCLFSSIGNGKEEETDSSLEALDELVFELWWPLERSEADHRNSTCSRAETGDSGFVR